MGDRIIEDILIALANPPAGNPLWREALEGVVNLLRLSEAIAERLSLSRYSDGGKQPEKLQIQRWREVAAAHEAVIFTTEQ